MAILSDRESMGSRELGFASSQDALTFIAERGWTVYDFNPEAERPSTVYDKYHNEIGRIFKIDNYRFLEIFWFLGQTHTDRRCTLTGWTATINDRVHVNISEASLRRFQKVLFITALFFAKKSTKHSLPNHTRNIREFNGTSVEWAQKSMSNWNKFNEPKS